MFSLYSDDDDDSDNKSDNIISVPEASFAISKSLVYYGKPNTTKYYTYSEYLGIVDSFDPPVHIDDIGLEKARKHPDYILSMGDYKLPIIMKVNERSKRSLLLQPAQKSCVIASFAMVYYDRFADQELSIKENLEKSEIKEVFELAANQTSCTLMEKLSSYHGLDIEKGELVFLDTNDLYNTLYKLFSAKAVALLQSINSKDIAGHQIVVDKVMIVDDKPGVVIRDSYNGILGVIDIYDFMESLHISYYEGDCHSGRQRYLNDDDDFYDVRLPIINDKTKCKTFSTYMVKKEQKK